ncbi:5'-3' exoribonuclease 1-like [Dreissena polymorpha]|uniref:5'-3' exoribonuclease 1-like n=1 Tax=Dreissena polymorpha TaxID=45954 RepID=UPI00226545CF|nr:5'-3' exoribonuclease 1-like [Dreissena polymorpha]
MAARMRELLSHSNQLQQFVFENNLERRSVSKWVDTNHEYLDFPSLDDNTLRLLTLGTYQLKFTGSYIQEYLGSDCNLQLYREMEGLIRVRPQTLEETTFHLLHLSLFREYLDIEFYALRDTLTDFDYNLENVIDDLVLMGFLVGNDFIPHLPNLDINNDALHLLWRTYMEVLPHCGGYINNGGRLNLERFEKYLAELSKFDFDTFSQQAGDLKLRESKKAYDCVTVADDCVSVADDYVSVADEYVSVADNFSLFVCLFQMIVCLLQMISHYDCVSVADDFSEKYSDEDTLYNKYKRNYYMTKMKYEHVTPEVLRDQAEGYVRGIQWILLYYYEGVPSWSWFYPHHYAPYMSDVKDFKDMSLTFDLGTPFLPFEQLMAVLPAASKDLLPPPYQSLMINDSSPVIDFYPPQFETDLNGKQQDWEAVVLIPFIDENLLLEAIRKVSHLLTEEDKSRNIHGPHLLYTHSETPGDTYPTSLPGTFPDIAVNHARLTKKAAFHLASSELRKGLLSGARLDIFYPGFPTLIHIPYKAKLSKEGVKVFKASSCGYNMMLHVEDDWCSKAIDQVAKEYLGKEVYVNWPHLYEAKVEEVCDNCWSYKYVEGDKSTKSGTTSPGINRVKQDHLMANKWNKERDSIAERYKDQLGVVVGNTKILLRALPRTGRKYILSSNGNVTMEKQFGNQPVAFALQATVKVKDLKVHDSSFCQFTSLTDYLPAGCQVFMLGWPNYGCQGEVLSTDLQSGLVRINLSILKEPELNDVIHNKADHDEQYFQGYELAQRLGISSQLFSQLTGSVLITTGVAEVASQQHNPYKVNVGLNLKLTKHQEEVPGFTRFAKGNKWLYSNKCVEILDEYIKNTYNLKDVQEYIKGLACTNIEKQKIGADFLSERVILALQSETNKVVEINRLRQWWIEMRIVTVEPHLLYKPMITSGALIPDSSATYELFDRVVNTRQGFTVPFGLRGTVVGIYLAEVEVNIMYDVLFDEDFAGGIAIRVSRSSQVDQDIVTTGEVTMKGIQVGARTEQLARDNILGP